jgi:predicted GNAT family N-acyltransferase
MTSNREQLTWEVRSLPMNGGGDGWLKELSAFRAEAFYDGGRLPQFQSPSGHFQDDDPLDAHAIHLLARSSGELVGCGRVLPLFGPVSGFIETVLGTGRLEELVNRRFPNATEIIEAGRLVVAPRFRSRRLVFRLMAAGVALAERIGASHVLSLSGSRFRQDELFLRCGFQYVPDVAPFFMPAFQEFDRLMFAEVAAPSPSLEPIIEEMRLALPLDNPRGSPLSSIIR